MTEKEAVIKGSHNSFVVLFNGKLYGYFISKVVAEAYHEFLTNEEKEKENVTRTV
jgi:hypothetical protein